MTHLTEARPTAPASDHALVVVESAHRVRQRALYSSLITGSARRGAAYARGEGGTAVVGGLALGALGAVRWQLARWFVEAPVYAIEDRVDGIELRRYPNRREVSTTVSGIRDLTAALDAGYDRLACYIYGANANGEVIARTTPMRVTRRADAYAIAFMLPTALPVAPRPIDPRVELSEVPETRIAARRMMAAASRDAISRSNAQLLAQVAGLGLVVRGDPALARYDFPTTLARLRRDEVWVAVA